MFKCWSPMSIGSWALLVFGGVRVRVVPRRAGARTVAGCAGAVLARLRPPARRSARSSPCSAASLGFYVAGYTGVLLAVTNRPIWSDTPLLGLLFLVSGASTSAALLILLGARRAV